MTKSEMRLERATRIFLEFIKLPDVSGSILIDLAAKQAMRMAIALENGNDRYEEIVKASKEKSEA